MHKSGGIKKQTHSMIGHQFIGRNSKTEIDEK